MAQNPQGIKNLPASVTGRNHNTLCLFSATKVAKDAIWPNIKLKLAKQANFFAWLAKYRAAVWLRVAVNAAGAQADWGDLAAALTRNRAQGRCGCQRGRSAGGHAAAKRRERLASRKRPASGMQTS